MLKLFAAFCSSRGTLKRLQTIALGFHSLAKHLGFGRTLDMSSGGVRFEADDTFDGSDIRHGEIQLDMEWPLLLGQVCRMKLVMRGRIVRWDNRWVAVRLEQYEFRTAGAIARTPEVRKRERATANSDGPYCR